VIDSTETKIIGSSAPPLTKCEFRILEMLKGEYKGKGLVQIDLTGFDWPHTLVPFEVG